MRNDVREARRIARILIAGAIGYILVSAVVWLARPGFFGPDDGLQATFDAAGFATMLFGLGWMIRIYRADPEPGERSWRYRS
jgi:hypothetical protein